MKEIEELLEKYFEGETSSAEEKMLREYFTSGEVAEHLRIHAPLFLYFKEEIGKENVTAPEIKTPQARKVLLWVSGVAAAILLLLGIGQVYVFRGDLYCSDNYVVINGRCYTDPHTVREHALNALQEVSATEKDAVETQFRELGSFFTDDEE
ncbi:MAG: hypothetical protein LBV32_07935 [Tannerellaceae bacterium]|jgi:hypothetical protein|nr:hypothetical protein [Tannerellaceae bacterium]